MTPLLDRRARDLFDRGATHHATAGFHSTGGNLNIEEPPPLHITAPPLWTDATSPRTRHLEELLLLSLEKDKKKLKRKKERPPGRLLGPDGEPVFSISAAAVD